jgi:hypothetical protein
MDDSNTPKTTTRKQGRHLRVPVLPDEEAAIKDNAARAGMSVAAYLRAIALGYPVRSVVDYQQVEELVKITGELERLSKLLEHWLNNDPRTAQFSEATLRAALARIMGNQEQMADTIRTVVRPRAER